MNSKSAPTTESATSLEVCPQDEAVEKSSQSIPTDTTQPSHSPLTEPRDIEVITKELLNYKQAYVEAAYEIGKLLLEAKGQLGHGDWLNWLRDRINFSERTAHRFMQLAKGYPDSTTLANLGYTKALYLLALPEAERSAFMKKSHKINGVEKGIDEMSARELEDAIRENNADKESASPPGGSMYPESPAESSMDADLQYVQECVDAMLDNIEKLIDDPASYNDLASALCVLCEGILQRLTALELDAS